MSLSELFWAGQKVYIEEIFPPILIGVALFFILLIILFLFGFGRRYRIWKLGQPEDRSGDFYTRLTGTLAVAVANIRIIRLNELYPGIMHVLMFGGTALLILGKIVRLFSYAVDLTTPPQPVFLYF
jgi:hypothetical protein